MEIRPCRLVWGGDRDVCRPSCTGSFANRGIGLCPVDSCHVYPGMDAEESPLWPWSLVVRVFRYHPRLEQVCLSHRMDRISDHGSLLFGAMGVVCAECS